VLALDRPELIDEIEPCLITQTDPDPQLRIAFFCQGFPVGYPYGAPAEGFLQGLDARGWIEAIADTDFGHFIEPGFSGAPVFARDPAIAPIGEIIGICVTADIGGRRVARLIPPAQLAFAARSVADPYRWLEHFTHRDVAFFFGREKLTKELSEALRRSRFILVAGPAGSGKSSLLQAGLLVNGRRHGMKTVVVRPVADVRAELALALGLRPDQPADNNAIRRAVEDCVSTGGLWLGIDQAERLVQSRNREHARQFLRLLAELREEFEDLQIAIVVRSDGLPALLAAQPPSRMLERNLHYIDELGREELREAIERPAGRLRVGFAPTLVRRIINDILSEERVSLSNLQFSLSQLWKSRTNATINEQAYRDLTPSIERARWYRLHPVSPAPANSFGARAAHPLR